MLWMDDAEQGYKRQNNLTKQHDKASQREGIEEPVFIPSAPHLSGSGTSLMTHHCFCWRKTGRSCKDNRWADTLCVFCNVLVAQWTKALGHLHIRATGDAWPWKPIPWSSWVTVSVLMLTAEEVLCSAITESDFYAVCNLVWFFKNPILCNRHYGPQCPLHSLPLQSVKRAWKRCSTLQ